MHVIACLKKEQLTALFFLTPTQNIFFVPTPDHIISESYFGNKIQLSINNDSNSWVPSERGDAQQEGNTR